VRLQRRQLAGQLHCHRGSELVSSGEIASAAHKKEAGAEPPGVGTAARHRAGYGRFPGARKAAEPENLALVVGFTPSHDFIEHGYTCSWVAQPFLT
jgi:hypothetical protein